MITNVLVLTKYERLGASSRVRCLQYIPRLAEKNCTFDVRPLITNEMLKYKYSHGNFPRAMLIYVVIKRIILSLKVSKYDVIWVQKEVFPYLPSFFDRLMLRRAKKVIVDIDDAEFLKYIGLNSSSKGNAIKKIFSLDNKYKYLFGRANVVVVGNSFLKKMVLDTFCSNTDIKIIPSVVDTSKYEISNSTQPRNVLRIGWIGTPYTEQYIEEILLESNFFQNIENIEIVLIGASSKLGKHPRVKILAWNEFSEVDCIKELDIGLMPLKQGLWEMGKCGYKAIQYMACGVPVIVSPVGVNAEIVEDGVNGYLCNDITAWESCIVKLLDSEHRKEIAFANRLKIVEYYSVNSQLEKIYEVLTR